MTTTRFLEFKDYERIKTIGKGAFGTAVLYRRKMDGKNVVLKEIHLYDMSDSEKQLAFNEATVLSSLNHPNIIRYMGSFEREGSLLIEMEYADNGNLAQLINVRKKYKKAFRETDIIDIASQITSALSYMHFHKILHRDLKTANIFLTKTGNIKVGDFGISKIMTTKNQAQTVVGTPYYLSPEMCEGQDYDEKSDIWAIGCVLYELVCLYKPFEAPTLPALVQKILQCEYDDIPEEYSEQLSQLINKILQRDQQQRPSAKYIYEVALPSISKRLSKKIFKNDALNESLTENCLQRSVLYHLSCFKETLNLVPVELPPKKKIISFSASNTHFIAVTYDNLVYTWGNDSFGQLAHGSTSILRKHPTRVEYLRGKGISKCAAGNGFSVFLNHNGVVLTCGDGKYGCLGHNNLNTLFRPTIVEPLISSNVINVCCGTSHVVALTDEGVVYTWGLSCCGQLGLGNGRFSCLPTRVDVPTTSKVVDVFAKSNSTICLDYQGQMYACGENCYEKLGVQSVENITTFTAVTSIKEPVNQVNMGEKHTVVKLRSGKLMAFGRNEDGQFGLGNCKSFRCPQIIPLKQDTVMIACGSTYTVAGTVDNALYFCGTRYNSPCISESNSTTSYYNIRKRKNETVQFQMDAESNTLETRDANNSFMKELIKKPACILALHASEDQVKDGQILWLEDLHAHANGIFILIGTSAPLRNNINLNKHEASFSLNNNVPTWMDIDLDSSAPTTLPNTPHLQVHTTL